MFVAQKDCVKCSESSSCATNSNLSKLNMKV